MYIVDPETSSRNNIIVIKGLWRFCLDFIKKKIELYVHNLEYFLINILSFVYDQRVENLLDCPACAFIYFFHILSYYRKLSKKWSLMDFNGNLWIKKYRFYFLFVYLILVRIYFYTHCFNLISFYINIYFFLD